VPRMSTRHISTEQSIYIQVKKLSANDNRTRAKTLPIAAEIKYFLQFTDSLLPVAATETQ